MTVSIITPMYNAAQHIESMILSVQAQSYTNWELIICDDCSTDDSVRLVKKYSTDQRIKLYKLTHNSGPAKARNVSLRESKGRFVTFLDSDDTWPPDKLQKQISFMRVKNIGFSYTYFHRITGNVTGKTIKTPRKLNYNLLIKNTAIATSTVMIDREIVKTDLKMAAVYYDDFVLWLDILRDGYVAYCLPEDLMEYRMLSGSVSRNKLKSAIEVWKIIRNHEKKSFLASVWIFMNWSKNALVKYLL